MAVTDRGSLPGHPPDLVGPGSQLVEAQGRGQRRERIVLEQVAGLGALLPQSLVILVLVLGRLAVGADAPLLLPEVLEGSRDARHAAGSGEPGTEFKSPGKLWKKTGERRGSR